MTRSSTGGDSAPNPVDRHVGSRICARRRELRISQGRLAKAIDLTFQQVQKYERGANRVSASKLWEIARTLEVSVSYFYEGLEGGATDGVRETDLLQDFLLTAEGQELAATFPKVRNAAARRSILVVVRALAAEPDAVGS